MGWADLSQRRLNRARAESIEDLRAAVGAILDKDAGAQLNAHLRRLRSGS